MPKYNFLKGNESEFPHIGNVNTYKYDNDFDYGRFDYTQMSLQICTVPWDMGEAHIGNRTISGIGNVVYFETKEKRDAWFNAIPDDECYRFTTKFKELHRDQYIDVPVPFDMCAKHNYLVVRYEKFANADSPVMYEGDDGLRDWFWFIREVEFLAPNTTRLHILDDAFQTWIYDINVSGMVLERGHAPMFAMRADEYLNNPLENNEYLLTDDVNFGEASQVKHIDALTLNAGNMYACIATTADPQGNWSNNVPALASYTNNGAPSVYVFAMAAEDLNSFLSNITSTYPQFKQTVQGVFFASADLLTLASSFTFANVTCYGVNSTRKKLNLTTLTKSLFGYDARYSDIAKLYTSPYAHIEVTDENGNVDIVKIEDSTGKLDVSAMISIAYPFVNIEAHLIGAGGSASATVTYKNVDSRTFDIGGQWYDTLRTWQVPTFAVVLDPATEYDYSTRFDRAQAVTDYTTAQSNANANADLITSNATLTTAANSAITNISNASASRSLTNTQDYNFGVFDTDNAVISATATSTIQASEEQAAVATAAGAATGAAGVLSSLANFDIGGAISSGVSAIVGGATTIANTAIDINLTSAKAQIAQDSNSDHAELSTEKSSNDISNQQTTATNIMTAQNTLTSGQAANSSATQKANASRNASAAQSAIDNGIAQAALREPFVYGSFANGDSATTKPMALFAHVVTQSKAAISSAGDEFLRYGYAFDKQWEFDGNWNVGKYFTYWKLRDFWVSNLNVPDMYMDRLRFFMFGGVTIWRNPEDIGKRTVYDNFNS